MWTGIAPFTSVVWEIIIPQTIEQMFGPAPNTDLNRPSSVLFLGRRTLPVISLPRRKNSSGETGSLLVILGVLLAISFSFKKRNLLVYVIVLRAVTSCHSHGSRTESRDCHRNHNLTILSQSVNFVNVRKFAKFPFCDTFANL